MFPCISCLAGTSGTGERVCCFRYFRSSWGIFSWNHAWLKPSSLGRMFVRSRQLSWVVVFRSISGWPKDLFTTSSHVWEEIRLLGTLLLINYRILFKKRNFEDNFSVNHKLQFVVYSNEWPNLDLKVSNATYFRHRRLYHHQGYRVKEFKDLFLQRNLSRRRNKDIIFLRPQTNFIRNSICYRGAIAWNSLTNN